jgi:hypothetical protein
MTTERLSEGPQFLQVRLTDLQVGFTSTITNSIRNIQFSIRNHTGNFGKSLNYLYPQCSFALRTS